MKKRFLGGIMVLVLAFFVFFPIGWLGTFSSKANGAILAIFPNERMHEVGHSAIFCAIGLALLYFFPILHSRYFRYIFLVLLAAIGQEFFQLLYKQRALAFDDFHDVIVDLIAASAAFGVVWLWQKIKRPRTVVRG